MTKFRNIPTDQLLDELVGVHTGREAPKPMVKFCIKAVSRGDLGELEPKLHCDEHVIETKKMGI